MIIKKRILLCTSLLFFSIIYLIVYQLYIRQRKKQKKNLAKKMKELENKQGTVIADS